MMSFPANNSMGLPSTYSLTFVVTTYLAIRISWSPMEQQDVARHFTDVASHYDDLYGFTYDYLPEFAIKHLELKPDDVLADIGAGTGAISSLIWKKAGNQILFQEQRLYACSDTWA